MYLNFLVGLMALSFIVFIHEFGHYIAARIGGVGIETFSVGMGKALFSFKDSRGTTWQFCLIPVGGYVHPKDAGDAVGLRFKEAGMIRGIFVAMAGPFFNFMTAFACFLFLSLHIGLPKFDPEIMEIRANSPAYAVLHIGDEVVAINGKALKSSDIKLDALERLKDPLLRINREGELLDIVIHKNENESCGIFVKSNFEKLSLLKAVKFSILRVYQGVYDTFSKVWEAIASFKIMGPIGIIKAAAAAQKNGLITMILFIAAVSIAIGSFNLLPIPALDGGRIIIFVVSAILRRPINDTVEKMLNIISIVLILSLFAIGLFNDTNVSALFISSVG